MIAITTCRYKIRKEDKYKNGFAICRNLGDNDILYIIDSCGDVIKNDVVYDYKLDPYLAAVVNMNLVLSGELGK